MALVVKDRVKETTTTTGTGALSLAGAEANFIAFSAALSDGDTTYYAIVDSTNDDFEVGLGTYASAGNTLTRTTVLASSNAGSAVNLSAGTKDVFVTYPADKSVYLDSSGNIASVTITSADINGGTIDGTTIGGTTAAAGTFTAFTSTGIDDNATSTAITIDSSQNVTLSGSYLELSNGGRLQVSSSSPQNADLTGGSTNGTDSDGLFAFYGGLSYNKGAGIVLNGEDHASLPNVTRFVNGAFVERMRIDSNGNVGIGTTDPSAANLNISASSDTNIRMFNTAGTGSWSQLSVTGANGQNLVLSADGDSSGSGNMIFRIEGNNERLRITTSAVEFKAGIEEQQYSLTGTAIDPSNGTIQYKTLGANTTFTESLADGEYVTLMIDDGAGYTITWPTTTWVGGSAPTLETSGYNIIELWHVNGVLYGAFVGAA